VSTRNATVKAVDFHNECDRKFTFLLMTEIQMMVLCAESDIERSSWIMAFNKSIKIANKSMLKRRASKADRRSTMFGRVASLSTKSYSEHFSTNGTRLRSASVRLDISHSLHHAETVESNATDSSLPQDSQVVKDSVLPQNVIKEFDLTRSNSFSSLCQPRDSNTPVKDVIDVQSSLSAPTIITQSSFDSARTENIEEKETEIVEISINPINVENEKWKVFLRKDEVIIATSAITKKNVMSVKMKR
jgi:hypothetical protein